MKALYVIENEKIQILDVKTPKADTEALVEILYSGICGSDTHVFLGHHPKIVPPAKFIQGHEAIGKIKSLPKGETNFNIGDRVAINPCIGCGKCFGCLQGKPNLCKNRVVMGFQKDGTMANFSLVPMENMKKLPDGINLKIATLLEPLAVCTHAVGLVKEDIKKYPIIIAGGGTIGALLAIIFQEYYKIKPIILEKNKRRLKQLEELGFTVALGLNEITLQEQPLFFECTGVKAVIDNVMESSSFPKKIVIIGQYPREETLSVFAMTRFETEVIGSTMYVPNDWNFAAKLLENPNIKNKIAQLIYPKIYLLSEAQEAFEMAVNGADGKIKILINCQAE